METVERRAGRTEGLSGSTDVPGGRVKRVETISLPPFRLLAFPQTGGLPTFLSHGIALSRSRRGPSPLPREAGRVRARRASPVQ